MVSQTVSQPVCQSVSQMASWIILWRGLVVELYNFYTHHQESQLACQGDGGMREAIRIRRPLLSKQVGRGV